MRAQRHPIRPVRFFPSVRIINNDRIFEAGDALVPSRLKTTNEVIRSNRPRDKKLESTSQRPHIRTRRTCKQNISQPEASRDPILSSHESAVALTTRALSRPRFAAACHVIGECEAIKVVPRTHRKSHENHSVRLREIIFRTVKNRGKLMAATARLPKALLCVTAVILIALAWKPWHKDPPNTRAARARRRNRLATTPDRTASNTRSSTTRA